MMRIGGGIAAADFFNVRAEVDYGEGRGGACSKICE